MENMLITSGYTDGYILKMQGKTGNPGICGFDFNPETGKLREKFRSSDSENPSFLAVEEGVVIAGCECVGTCYAEGYSFNGNEVVKKTSVLVPGTAMCHVCVWPEGKFASFSNYTSGDIAVVSLKDGMPDKLVHLISHNGVGFDKERQEGPHIHSSFVSPSGKYLLVADLGLDKVFVYSINTSTGDIVLDDKQKSIQTPLGEGPRHMCFSPDGNNLYVITELGCRVFAYSWNEEIGAAEYLEDYPLLPDGYSEFNLAADIRISHDGRFVYASNRGADNIIVFSRDSREGKLTEIYAFPLKGSGPRIFALNEDNTYMAVACQKTGEIHVYSVGTDGIPGELCDRKELPQVSFCKFINV